MYNFRCDPDLGIGKTACRRIPCACPIFLEKLNNFIDLDDKGVNERCVYWRNFKGYNNWRVVDLVTTNVTSEEDEKVYEIIFHGIEARINKRILIGKVDAMISNDEATQGYYLVE